MSVRAIFVQYFLCNELMHVIDTLLTLVFYRIDGEGTPTKPDLLIESLVNKARTLGLATDRFEQSLATHISALAAGKKPPQDLYDLLIEYNSKLEKKISEIPNTLDKTQEALMALVEVEAFIDVDQVYDAMVLLNGMILPDVIAGVVRNWKESDSERKESSSSIFWVSRDSRETIDSVSRYRFREHFGIGEFPSAFADVEYMLALSLLEGSSGLGARVWGDYRLMSVAYDLWLTSRSQALVNRLRNYINVALQRISAWQFSEGWWSSNMIESAGKDPETGRELHRRLPSTHMTTLCSLNLLKLGMSEQMRKQGVIGVHWLLEKQNSDGSWPREKMAEDGVSAEPDLFVTLLALEAIARSGIENVERSFSLGVGWVMKQQNDLGMWDDEGFPFPFMTVLALEFLQSREYYPKQLDPYLSMSKGFLNRSVQLSLEDDVNSHQLAIIAAFQGIEAFLYSVLSHSSVNVKIFQKADETIGMRKALVQLQNHLQQTKRISRSEVISYRNSLDDLAYLRDQVVHKCIEIAQSRCRSIVDDALGFARKYSLEIHGHDPWA